MNTPIVEYEGDQLEIDFNLDRPEFSICPSCAGQVIKLSEGCGVYGWSEEDKKLLGGEEKLLLQKEEHSPKSQEISIPCLVKQPNQPELKGLIREDLGDRFDVYIPDSDSTITVSKLFVYPDLKQLDKCSSKIIPASKKNRVKGKGSGWIECKPIKRNGKEYKQYWYHYETWREGDRVTKKCKYIPQRMRSQIEKMNDEKAPVEEILKVLRNRSKRKK